MGLDWGLACVHHLAVFALAGILAFELALTAGRVDAATARRIAAVDGWYGILAAVVLAAGLARVFFGVRGAGYYAGNALFWAKMALFAVIGLLSVLPTLRFIGWSRAARKDAAYVVPADALAATRRLVWLEVALFAGLPVLAAGMARGFGM